MTTAEFDPRIGEIARSEHRHLLDVAFRMLGDVGRAEDMVQEAFLRLARTDLDSIHDVRGWLVVVVGRLCLDHLRSASARRKPRPSSRRSSSRPWRRRPRTATPTRPIG